MLISIEGNIGSGKSTLVEYLKSLGNYIFVDEPVNEWLSIKDKDGSNDGLWLSKKGPHHVAISAGYRYNGHPDLALFQEFILIDCLRDTENDVFLLEDLHSVTIGIPDFKDIEYAKGQLSPIFEFMAIDKNPKWSIFTTKKSIYSTASSGDLRYVFKADGSLVDFSREY